MSRNVQSRTSANVHNRRQMPRQSQLQQHKAQASASSATNNGHLATEQEYQYLIALRDGYKTVAINYNRSGNKAKALSMLRISKQLSLMTQAVQENRPVDVNGLPPMPPKPSPLPSRQAASSASSARIFVKAPHPSTNIKSRPITQTGAAPTRNRIHPEIEDRLERISLNAAHSSSTISEAECVANVPLASQDEEITRLFDAPTSASSTMDALHQRLEKYKSTMDSASAEGNASKVRRLGRIVKQYENAIAATTKGDVFDYDSLPTPPGYPPIPKPSHRTVIKVSHELTKNRAPLPPAREQLERPKTELNAKVDLLTRQQNTLKKAALAAKEAGDKSKALELFRMAKGLDNIIEAVKCGLPYDPQSIPPQLNQIISEVENKLSQGTILTLCG